MYNLVVGVAREDVHEERMLGGDDRGWGFFVTLASGRPVASGPTANDLIPSNLSD